MTLTKSEFSNYVKQFQFREMFNEMGWNNDRTEIPVTIDEHTYLLKAVAEKSGFKILLCQSDGQKGIPLYNTRKKIETKVTKLFQEHLIIFIDDYHTEQLWQWVLRQSGKPAKVTETRYHISQAPELLYQRAAGIFFEFDEEENITIVDVTRRVEANFHQNNEKVTKKFYEQFKKEHISFLKFIKGIEEKTNKDWYASLMLNRLMFCYFIQKKGFLDNNINYLRDKLNDCKEKRGKNQFYSFYRNFLLVLFHKGLNQPKRQEEITVEIGRVPYLNGGLFDEHELEKSYTNIDIDDKAFERLFNFFDEYNWHLDTSHTASGKDINPDVIGYIFEKYINDRAQMGAYYTKEDITDYISKNCVLPYLFDETQRNYAKAFKPEGELWQMVKNSGDKYIYEAVKKGVSPGEEYKDLENGDDRVWNDLPEEVRQGINPHQKGLVEKRKCWNHHAPEEIALPTEIYREIIARRKRYYEIKDKIDQGEITHINDFITYNLNIRQFAQDAIENTTDPAFLTAFYKALNTVSILDPTCGSGAFLFAALNILEPLYEACIGRMENFVSEAPKGKYQFFADTLKKAEAPEHPNLQYFIYKSIILNNLYGVDIMREAVEIAKLRLFLKLVATVDADYRKPNLGLEPLPDIDFNIRAGNTLIGFATKTELKKGGNYTFDFDQNMPKIEEQCDIVARTFKRYKEIQLSHGDDYAAFKKAKTDLNKRLKELNHELNQLLHKQYSGIPYDQWLTAYQPFHWFAEFYDIVHENRGFDVIIGNPPYISMSKIKYKLKGVNFQCSDLYGYIIKRGCQILNMNSRYGFIVMHNLAFSKNFSDVRKTIKNNAANAWFSFFARIPSGLFSGDVRVRNCIFILENKGDRKGNYFFSTRIYRWFAGTREFLFQKINYTSFVFDDVIPMLSGKISSTFFENSNGKSLSHFEVKNSKFKLFFKQSAYNWIAVSLEPAPCFDSSGRQIDQSQVSDISFKNHETSIYSLLILNGKFFFSHWLTYGDEFHVTRGDLTSIKVPYELIGDNDKEVLNALFTKFSTELKKTVQYKLNAGKKVGTYNTSKLWQITDQSDRIFLKYLCKNPEEVFEAIEDHVSQTVLTESDI